MNQFQASDLDNFIDKYSQSIYHKHPKIDIIRSIILALLWYRYQSEELATGMKLPEIRQYFESKGLINYREWVQLGIEQDIFLSANKDSHFFYDLTTTKYSLRTTYIKEYEKFFLPYIEQDKIIENLDVVKEKYSNEEFIKLTDSIQQEIKNSKPELALSNLHTLIMKMTKMLCDKHGIDYDKKDTLNGIFGRYRNYLNKNNLIKSKMSNKILKLSIDILEAYNDVRNNHSSAHANQLLNSHESNFICENISSFMKFVIILEENLENARLLIADQE